MRKFIALIISAVHQTCYVRESYVQLTEFCPTCGYVFSQTVVHHESHTICNINY